MAKSREEFMREMGITSDDTVIKESKYTKMFNGNEAPQPAPRAQNRESSSTIGSSSMRKGSDMYTSKPTPSASSDYEYSAKRTPMVEQHQQSGSPVVSSGMQRVHYEEEVPTPQPIHRKPVKQNSAREDFLRSLGIDNMDHPEETPSPTRSAKAPPPPPRNTASQEIYKDSAAILRAEHSSSAKENMFSSASPAKLNPEMAETHPYRPSMQEDNIMGMRKSSKLNKQTAGSPSKTNSSKSFSSGLPDGTENMSALELKNMGNTHFEEGDFRKAVRLYSKAIEKDPANAALYSNRSAAYLQASKQMGIDTRMMSLRDADKVIELKPQWFKGYSRRGDALFKLDRAAEAADAYQMGLQFDEGNVNLLHSLGEAKGAAGKTRPTHASAWQTAAVSKPAVNKSAHELVEELKNSMSQVNPEAKVGNDYRAEALERFRTRKPTSSLSSFCGAPSQEYPASPIASNATLDRSQISEEFSSRAAFNYQQGLLDAYRKKKTSSF